MSTDNNVNQTPATGANTDPKASQNNNPPPNADKVKELEAELAKQKAVHEKALHDLNEEAKKHRLDAKAKDEKNILITKALNLLQGKPLDGEPPDPAALEKARTDGRIRRAYLKAEFVAQGAAELQDASFTFDSVEASLTGVTVDLETGKVDSAAVKAKLGELKKERAFLFKPAGGGTSNTTVNNPPDNSGNPAGGGDELGQWNKLKEAGRLSEAQEYYNKNRLKIVLQMK